MKVSPSFRHVRELQFLVLRRSANFTATAQPCAVRVFSSSPAHQGDLAHMPRSCDTNHVPGLCCHLCAAQNTFWSVTHLFTRKLQPQGAWQLHRLRRPQSISMICTQSAGSVVCQTSARSQPVACPRAQVSCTLLRVSFTAVLLITNGAAAHMQVSLPLRQCSQKCSSFSGSIRRLQQCRTQSSRRLTGVTCL